MAELPKTTALDLEFANGWLTVWFNQPEIRNALTDERAREIRDVFSSIRDDRSVRGVTLRGRGSVFCAGGDLKSFQSALSGEATRDDIIALSKNGAAVFDSVASAPQFVIALIEGPAMAGGLGLACCADLIISTSDAQYSLTETMIGLSPAQIAPFVIRKLGFATARRLMLTAARFDGAEGEQLGLVDLLAENVSDLASLEAEMKTQVLKSAPGAIAETKSLLHQFYDERDRSVIVQSAAETFANRMLSEEGREGVLSFVQKRKPDWVVKSEDNDG